MNRIELSKQKITELFGDADSSARSWPCLACKACGFRRIRKAELWKGHQNQRYWCSGRDSNPGLRLSSVPAERPEYLAGLYYRSISPTTVSSAIGHVFI